MSCAYCGMTSGGSRIPYACSRWYPPLWYNSGGRKTVRTTWAPRLRRRMITRDTDDTLVVINHVYNGHDTLCIWYVAVSSSGDQWDIPVLSSTCYRNGSSYALFTHRGSLVLVHGCLPSRERVHSCPSPLGWKESLPSGPVYIISICSVSGILSIYRYSCQRSTWKSQTSVSRWKLWRVSIQV